MKETRFKQTEIGLIPEDWEVVTISKIAETSSGGTPSRSINRYYNGNIRWITTSELKDSRIYDSIEHITEEAVQNSSAKMFPKGTVLMAMYGATIGKLGILEVCSTTNQACCAIICRDIKNIYLFYYLFFIRKEIILQGCGAGQPNISQNIVKNINIGLPKEIEQKKIASALTSIDNLLLSLDKLIEKKRLIKQGAMQELLTGKKRLPGFAGEWVERRLGEISKIYRGGSPRPIENYLTTMNDGINWIKIGDVDKSAKYIYKTQERIKPSGVSSSRYVKSGDFLLSNSMSFGRPYILKTSGCIHDGWLVIQDYQQYCDCDFLYYTLSSNYILQQYKAKAAGSSVLNLNKDIASNVIMKYPKDILEQKAIAKVLSCIDKEIESLEGKKAKYEQIKQGMMQLLLTGKIRLIS